MIPIHVVPNSDLSSHVTNGTQCACSPKEHSGKNKDGSFQQFVLHNALDGHARSQDAQKVSGAPGTSPGGTARVLHGSVRSALEGGDPE